MSDFPGIPGHRRPVSSVDPMPVGRMRNSTARAKQKLRDMSPDMNWGLGLAKVVNVDYEELTVTLRVFAGASQMYERVPVGMTFPGAGARHFVGSLPLIGDLCVVGWMPQESSEKGGGTRTPVVLTWIVPGTWPGREWLTTTDFGIDEFDTTSPKEKALISSAFSVQRHKLRHIQPGNVVASSAQGSDLVLDEGVLLSNRRGNEIRLRDQDQAVIVRSLQQFHAMAGARIYAGMVQRDATFLPTTMVSDGRDWATLEQSVNGVPLSADDLPASPSVPKGFLTPAPALAKSRVAGSTGRSLNLQDNRLDPFNFLKQGGFIRDSGFVADGKHAPDAQYGGKPIFRVAAQGKSNAVLEADRPTLTEFRIEVAHTSDGRLPVTEQTDMFDAERLPGSAPDAKTGLAPTNVPFIEWVMGSVVGNDPFSQEGRKKYGMPLVAKVFDGDRPVPRLEPAVITSDDSDSSSTNIGDHLAMLFRMVPPLQNLDTAGTFWGVNKQGQFKASIAGDPKEYSAEIAMAGSLKIGLGGGMRFISDGHLEWVTRSQSSLNIKAEEGSVVIYGGGPVKDNAAAAERAGGSGGGEGDVPSVDIVAKTNARVKAERLVSLKGQRINASATTINLTGNEELTLDGVRKTSITTENFQKSVSAKAQESYTGPKYGQPTNFPLHERTYAPVAPGVCEKVTYTLGDREEAFTLGSHRTSIQVGNMTYETNQGTWSARAVSSKMELGATGMSALVPTGTVTLTASAGTASMAGFAGVSVVSKGGQATVRGATGVYLGAPITGPDKGPIVCAGSLEPFTGLPFATWGIGAKNHIVGV